MSSSEKASDEDHATIEYAMDFSELKIGQPGEMEILHKAKGILEEWINFDAKNPNNGSFKIYLQKVNDLINANQQVEESRKKNEQMKAGRRKNRKNQKSRNSKKSRKVRKTRKN
jgi:hypothetical protein